MNTGSATDRRRELYGLRIDARCVHDVVSFIEREIFVRRLNRKDVCYKAGLGQNAIDQWVSGRSPTIRNADAVLQVLGYRLTVDRIDGSKEE